MEELFASLYEWFGINPLYSTDMGDYLRGWDITCTDYIGTPWYVIIGWLMIAVIVFFYALQYHIFDSSRFNKKHHWWIIALVIVLLNFLTAFLIPFNGIQAGEYCSELNLSNADCFGFAISNSVWSFVLFTLLTSFKYPRYLAVNCRYTTFWKP